MGHEKFIEWPVWPKLRIRDAQLYGCSDLSQHEADRWPGEYVHGDQAPNLLLELVRINRARKNPQLGDNAIDRAQAFLKIAAFTGPLGQKPQVAYEANSWVALEHIDWALAHAAALDFVLTLKGAIALGHSNVLQAQFGFLQNWTEGLRAAQGSSVTLINVSNDIWHSGQEERVAALIDLIIKPNIEAQLTMHQGSILIEFKSLYRLLYAQLAEWLQAPSFGRCETCLTYFPKTDQRQRFCPPTWPTQKESQCGIRARMRRRRGATDRLEPTDIAGSELLLRQNNQVPLALRLDSSL